jgi:hypothetical protein
MRRLILLVALAVACTGCFRATTTITVHPDGSGLIDQEVGISSQARALLSSMGGRGDAGANPDITMFGPEQAQKIADSMGVRFVSGEPVKNADLEGYRAHYAFDDITQVRLKRNQTATAGMSETKGGEPLFNFAFARRGANSVLTVQLPTDEQAATLPALPGVNGQGAAGADQSPESQQAMAMASTLLRGLFVDVSLAVDGRIVRSTAPAALVDGSKVTLFQMDFDKLLASPGALQKLQQKDPKVLRDLPGIKLVEGPTLEIEFAR